MKENSTGWRNLIELNIGLLLIATSGPLGRYIDIPVPVTIFTRALIGGLVLYIFAKVKGISFAFNSKDRIRTLLAGLLFGAHWVTYFFALKLSGVALGMISLYTYPVMTALLEPFVLKTKVNVRHLLFAGMVLFGVFMLTPNFSLESDSFIGICFGVTSALCYTLRNLLLKPLVVKHDQSVLMINQLFVIALALSPSLFLLDISNMFNFIPELLTLSLATTAIGHTLFVASLKNFTTTSASLLSSMQPIYGILLAMLFLKEFPNTSTIFGGLIIISTVVIEAVVQSRQNKRRTTL